jgi:hypothetical protein
MSDMRNHYLNVPGDTAVDSNNCGSERSPGLTYRQVGKYLPLQYMHTTDRLTSTMTHLEAFGLLMLFHASSMPP